MIVTYYALDPIKLKDHMNGKNMCYSNHRTLSTHRLFISKRALTCGAIRE